MVNADLYVSPDGSNANSGLTATEPLKNINIAIPKIIADSLNPHTIHLMKGTYSGNSNHEAFPVEIPPYVSLKGVSSDSVILQGDETTPVLSIINNPSTTISGMTIQEGNGDNGGGIHCINSSPLLQNLVVRNNWAFNGGGMFCYQASPVLKNVRFTNNNCRIGGGLFIRYSNPYLQDVRVDNNFAFDDGGGICCFNSSPIFRNLRLQDNSSQTGGGIAIAGSNVLMQNALITGNTGTLGGGIYYESDTLDIMQMTLTGNIADFGGGIFCRSDSPRSIKNSILWNDSLYELYWTYFTISYSNIEGGNAGQGNISQDPLFIGTSPEPYSLSFGSPCIDAGTPDPQWLSLPPWDILGNQRIWDGDGDGNATVDMGAYEYGATLVGVPSNNNQINSSINCYPNPFVNQATISYSLTESCHVTMIVLNQLGQTVEVLEDAFQTQGNKTISLDAEHYPDGLYYLHLLAGDKVSALKTVK